MLNQCDAPTGFHRGDEAGRTAVLLRNFRRVFPTLDALNEGYEVYPVTDAIGGTSLEAHRAALERMVQAGARPTTWNSVHCELQRDWNRTKTVPGFVQTFVEHGRPGWFFNLEVHCQKRKK